MPHLFVAFHLRPPFPFPSYTFVCAKTSVPQAPGDMRLFSALPLLGLLLGTRASSHRSREPASHRLDVRDPAIDVCANIDVILVTIGNVNISESIFFIIIDIPTLVPVFLKRINRRMYLSVGPSHLPRDEHQRRCGR
jgi:hypothetical protein